MPHRTPGGLSQLGRRLAGAAGLLAAAIAGRQVARYLRDRGTPAVAGTLRPDQEFRGSATGAAETRTPAAVEPRAVRAAGTGGARSDPPGSAPTPDTAPIPDTAPTPGTAPTGTAPIPGTHPELTLPEVTPPDVTPPELTRAGRDPAHAPPTASARQPAGSGEPPGPVPQQTGATVSRAGRRAASVMIACGLALAALGVNAVSGSPGSVVAGWGSGSFAGAPPSETAAPLAPPDRPGLAPPPPSARPSGAATPVPSGASEETPAAGAEPVRRNLADPLAVRIPAVGIDAPLGPLGLAVDGTLNAPTDYDRAGWYVGGPEPGEIGPALIAGHVDSFQGPAAFFRLRAIRPGDAIEIPLADGQTAVFAATATEQHPKTAFPTERVYGATPAPELRLVTCGGGFNATARSYEDNVIVFASFVELRPAAAP